MRGLRILLAAALGVVSVVGVALPDEPEGEGGNKVCKAKYSTPIVAPVAPGPSSTWIPNPKFSRHPETPSTLPGEKHSAPGERHSSPGGPEVRSNR